MPEAETTTIDTSDSSHDFASMAMKTITEDPEKPTPPKQDVVKTEVKPAEKKDDPKSKIPDSLFEKTPKQEDAAAQVKDKPAESEIDKIQKPDFKNPKAAEQWDTLRARAVEFEKKFNETNKATSELQSKLAEYESKLKSSEELQAKYSEMEKKHRESMELVQKVNIELDPEFRRMYVDGRNNLIKQARNIVDESGGNADDIQTALNLSGKSRVDALSTIAEGMNNFQQGRLGRVIDALTQLDEEASAKRTNPSEYLSQRERQMQEETARSVEEQRKHANLAYEDAFSKASSEIEVLRHVDGMNEWNQQADAIRTKALNTWQTNRDMSVAARKFIDAEAMPVFRELFLDARQEAKDWKSKYEEASKELSSIHGNKPGMRTKTAAAPDGKGMYFADRVTGTMNGSIPVNNE